MTGTQILAIRRPEDLFPGDLAKAKRAYHKLALQWHPDRAQGVDPAVFAHIAHLYELAEAKIAAGTWEGSSAPFFDLPDGSTLRLNVLTGAPFLLGFSYVSENAATYVVNAKHAQYVQRLRDLKFPFASNKMQTEVAKYLPTGPTLTKLGDGRHLVQVRKTPDLLCLRDVVTHLGPLDPKHVAWIVSSLMNLCCYLSYAGLVHHDISPDTYFISPPHHSGALLGGWWFWQRSGDPLTAIPRRTAEVVPFKVRRDKRASRQTDLELVRLTAREIAAPLPEPMNTWIQTPGTGSAVEQYQEWADVRDRTFGQRKFTPMLVDAETVYRTATTVT